MSWDDPPFSCLLQCIWGWNRHVWVNRSRRRPPDCHRMLGRASVWSGRQQHPRTPTLGGADLQTNRPCSKSFFGIWYIYYMASSRFIEHQFSSILLLSWSNWSNIHRRKKSKNIFSLFWPLFMNWGVIETLNPEKLMLKNNNETIVRLFWHASKTDFCTKLFPYRSNHDSLLM